ncbi:uncharacterized protein FTOL_04455 [Fusarium torulosum]|uniref:Uncharacterized protein n=1 Tax=Fusarium torulosum TaxID=33205 RepID=A0AAE8M5X3_9HYPO|nr:uncharacterized protein FTOL_04455 [Fusarium torulosum]
MQYYIHCNLTVIRRVSPSLHDQSGD